MTQNDRAPGDGRVVDQSAASELHWWALALAPVAWVVTKFYGLAGLIIWVALIAVVAVNYVALKRRGLDGEKIVGGIIGVLGGVWGVVALLVTSAPSSVMWMSAIVCSSPHHLAYDVSHYSYRPGESSSTVAYACVSDENVYEINRFLVSGLQAAGVAFVMCVVTAISFPIWRRWRRPNCREAMRCQRTERL